MVRCQATTYCETIYPYQIIQIIKQDLNSLSMKYRLKPLVKLRSNGREASSFVVHSSWHFCSYGPLDHRSNGCIRDGQLRLSSVVRRRLSRLFQDFLVIIGYSHLDMLSTSVMACENFFQRVKRSMGVAARAINVKTEFTAITQKVLIRSF